MAERAAIDLDAYLDRIGHQGRREPSLAALREIVLAHLLTIPFENLDPLLGLTPRLDLPDLEAKLVRGRRGGYCFEHNPLLQQALAALGFGVRAFGGRVLYEAPQGSIPPRTHALLEVTAEGERFIVDVGFGGLTPTGPVQFVPGRDEMTPHGAYRIETAGDEFELHAMHEGAWRPLYRFATVEQPAIDHEVANHYVATWPTSFFRKALVVVRAMPGGRFILHNDRLAFRRLDGSPEEMRVPDGNAVLKVLDEIFGLAVPDPDGVRAAFARVTASVS